MQTGPLCVQLLPPLYPPMQLLTHPSRLNSAFIKPHAREQTSECCLRTALGEHLQILLIHVRWSGRLSSGGGRPFGTPGILPIFFGGAVMCSVASIVRGCICTCIVRIPMGGLTAMKAVSGLFRSFGFERLLKLSPSRLCHPHPNQGVKIGLRLYLFDVIK